MVPHLYRRLATNEHIDDSGETFRDSVDSCLFGRGNDHYGTVPVICVIRGPEYPIKI